MELCSLEDAFPDIGKNERKSLPKPGCTDAKPSKEERRAARKKAKKCKGADEEYLAVQDDTAPPVDPDRPAVKRLGEVPAFVSYSDAFPDLSGVITEGFKLPGLPSSNCTFSDAGLPAYFGKGLDDEDKEGFADFTMAGVGVEPKGVEKAAGSGSATLPAPNLDDAWKPLTRAKATTAFYKEAATPKPSSPAPALPPVPSTPGGTAPGAPAAAAVEAGTRETLLAKIQELTRRLDDLEKRSPRNTQKELLMFVGAGIFLLVGFDIVVKASK